jgi:flagellar biosynthesis protein FliQ
MMTPSDLHELGREALILVIVLSLPFLGAALLSGVIAGLFQSFTRMTEPTINHVARITAVLLVALAVTPFVAGEISGFAERIWSLISVAGR